MMPDDSPKATRQTSWRETPLDYKFFVIYQICMMALFITGGFQSVAIELTITIGLIVTFIFLTIRQRQRTGWRWPGVTTTGVISGLASILLGGLFLFSVTPMASPSNPNFLPWYLAVLGALLYWLLRSLQIVGFSRTNILKKDSEIESHAQEFRPKSHEALWKKIVRIVFWTVVLIGFLEGLATFYYFGVTYQNGSPTLTATQTEPLNDHGRIVYITPEEKSFLNLLEGGMELNLPIMASFLIFIHFILGVRIVSRIPTMWELWKRMKSVR
jgi:hypothetical protein